MPRSAICAPVTALTAIGVDCSAVAPIRVAVTTTSPIALLSAGAAGTASGAAAVCASAGCASAAAVMTNARRDVPARPCFTTFLPVERYGTGGGSRPAWIALPLARFVARSSKYNAFAYLYVSISTSCVVYAQHVSARAGNRPERRNFRDSNRPSSALRRRHVDVRFARRRRARAAGFRPRTRHGHRHRARDARQCLGTAIGQGAQGGRIYVGAADRAGGADPDGRQPRDAARGGLSQRPADRDHHRLVGQEGA